MKIKFKRDTSFRKQFFVPDSFAHPAKMDAQLLIWIVEHYSKEGETILDPMAGSGTTMLACTLGRNVILVELEEKFCKMMRDNWEQVKMRPQLGSTMGDCQIIQGDARQLENIPCDKIISSPPYIAQTSTSKQTEGLFKGRQLFKNGRDPQPHSEGQIGDLPYNKVDKIVTSPPYAEAHNKDSVESWGGLGKDRADLADYRWVKEDNPNNIGNLPYGEIDKCIFSPPYADMVDGSGEGPLVTSKKNPSYKPMPNAYGQIDKIVTSPPFQDQTFVSEFIPPHDSTKLHHSEYAPSKNNIGNLKSQSYLEAMLQVYQQCYKVLKPRGLMILVTKNFIRNKQVVRLDEDTIKLCEQAGFSFVERHYRELPSQSFWRVIYHQKFPGVEQIKNEDVLVFSK